MPGDKEQPAPFTREAVPGADLEAGIAAEDPVADAARFNRTEQGVTLITADMLARL